MSVHSWMILSAALICAVLAAIMTAVETAWAAISPMRAERMVADGMRSAQQVKTIIDDPAPTMTASMLFRVICEVCATVFVTFILVEHVDSFTVQLCIAILIMIAVSFIAWGVAPKTLGYQHAESLAIASAPVVSIISFLLWPISQLMIWLGNLLTPGQGFTDGPFSYEAEKIAEASEGEREMINSVFELGETLVRQLMVPRTDVVYIDQSKTLRQGLSLCLRSGFSRIPVVDQNIDNVVGIVYLKDLSQRVYDNPEADRIETIESIMRPASFVPDSKAVDDLMKQMQKTRHHMVIIIDEFGGMAGIATIEDLVEEIVGEITDEYDSDPDMAEQIDAMTWRISARMSVDDMGDLFGAELDDEDVETVGGLLAKQLNMVPIKGSQILWNGLEITAENSTSRRHQIDTVIVRKVDESIDNQGEDDE